MKGNVKLRKTLKNTVLLNSEVWFRILCQLKKLIMSTGKIHKVNFKGQSMTWIIHIMNCPLPLPLAGKEILPEALDWKKNELVERLAEIIHCSENSRSLGVSPGPPATAQMNKFSEGNFFLQPTPSSATPFEPFSKWSSVLCLSHNLKPTCWWRISPKYPRHCIGWDLKYLRHDSDESVFMSARVQLWPRWKRSQEGISLTLHSSLWQPFSRSLNWSSHSLCLSYSLSQT